MAEAGMIHGIYIGVGDSQRKPVSFKSVRKWAAGKERPSLADVN